MKSIEIGLDKSGHLELTIPGEVTRIFTLDELAIPGGSFDSIRSEHPEAKYFLVVPHGSADIYKIAAKVPNDG